MHDGSILEAYLNSKRVNKQKFADSLKMSKQNLYQLFDSKKMQAETKASLEAVIGLKWDKIEQEAMGWVNIDGNLAKRNGSVRNAPDYRDEMIALLKEKLSLSERRVLQYAEMNNALLKTVLWSLAELRAKSDKRKLSDVQVEMNNQVKRNLDLLRKEGI